MPNLFYKIDIASYPSDFPTPATSLFEGMIHFHHDLMVVLTFICFFVLWMIVRTFVLFSKKTSDDYVLSSVGPIYAFNFYKHQGIFLEIVWTIAPAAILMLIATPSFALLYSTSELLDSEFFFKIVGHQWYWSYEQPVYELKSQLITSQLCFDSYLDDQKPYLVCTTNVPTIPSATYIRFVVTSDDVLHSWTVPAFGIKMDACPGRLNSVILSVLREGVFLGACSEICGINHAFMPINVLVTNLTSYITTMTKC